MVTSTLVWLGHSRADSGRFKAVVRYATVTLIACSRARTRVYANVSINLEGTGANDGARSGSSVSGRSQLPRTRRGGHPWSS